jgi:hypothetical protein
MRPSAAMRFLVFSNWSEYRVMPDPEWPPEQYRLAPNDYLAALGQVTFVYNMLESMMSNIFQKCSPVADIFAKSLFHKLNNRDRVDLLSAFINENENDKDVLDALLYCILCYDICTENRNILMHSIYFNPNPEMTRLVKRASGDASREIHFDVPLSDLRMIADQTVEVFRYAINLFGFVSRREFIAALPPTDPVSGYPKIGPNPLPEKPPKPHKLTPYQPQAAQPSGAPQPGSSGAKF